MTSTEKHGYAGETLVEGGEWGMNTGETKGQGTDEDERIGKDTVRRGQLDDGLPREMNKGLERERVGPRLEQEKDERPSGESVLRETADSGKIARNWTVSLASGTSLVAALRNVHARPLLGPFHPLQPSPGTMRCRDCWMDAGQLFVVMDVTGLMIY